MGFKHSATVLLLAWEMAKHTSYAAIGDDYVTELPVNIYQNSIISPQNADFDRDNNRFIAHPGWYNDIDIHYYKFRMYVCYHRPLA